MFPLLWPNSLMSSLQERKERRTRAQEMPMRLPVVFMGHGTEHPANSAYSQMVTVLAADYKKVFLGTVEGYPTYDEVLTKLKEAKVKNVRLMPFMVVAGDHALNDLTGNETDSWKSMLEKQGFKVDFNLRGLGEIDDIAKIFVQHTKDALTHLSVSR